MSLSSSGVPVVVHDHTPCYRSGLEHALAGAGHRPERPTDLPTWARAHASHGTGAGILATVGQAGGAKEIADLTAYPSIVVVALLRVPEPAAFWLAIEAGSAGVVDWAAPIELITEAFEGALRGRLVIPLEVARGFRPLGESAASAAARSEIDWLQRLARGCTVAQVADACHYSEREMYRRLRGLYSQLGVSGRVEAIARALHLGLIE